MNFLKNSHFALFGLFGKNAKNTKFINDTPHTQKYRYTQTHAHTDTDSIFAFYTFWLIWHTYQRY